VFGSCGSGAGGNYVVAVRPGTTAAPDAELAYTIDRSAPYVPTPLARGDLVFLWGDLGMVSCIDAASGALHWRERVEGNFFGSPVLVEDRVYCLSVEGDAVVLAASDEFELLARVPLGEYSHATPAVAGGRMYLRTYSHLMSLGGE
jgi:outer membrane protein assembly factor BamB